MDSIRLILIFSLVFILMLLYQAWLEDYGQPTTPSTAVTAPASETPQAPTGAVPALPPLSEPGTPMMPSAAATSEGTIRVTTDTLTLLVSLQGGNIVSAHLNDYLVHHDDPSETFQLLKPEPPNLFVSQSGLIAGDAERAPTHEARYTAAAAEYRLVDGADTLVVPLTWSHPDGIKVVKELRLRRGGYLIDVVHRIDNGSGAAWNGRDYGQLVRTEPTESGNQFIYTFTGATYYSPDEKYEKIAFDDFGAAALDRDITDGWLAMIQHYFLGAWIPPRGQSDHYYAKKLPTGRYLIGSYSPAVVVAPGASHAFARQVYVGPKLQDQLEQIAAGLELTVDYGWLTIIAKPLFWLLETIHDWVNNWGFAIIILTLLIKLAFYKLSETSYRSMANMRKLTPRIQALRDRFGDDKQRMQQAMMEIYKKEKINPLGGCLPILVQIPVFIALYWVLLESVELRHAPFVLWIQNLSDKDPYYILPLLMGASMFIQQKLNPPPPDPMQAKIMMSLPFVFTIFFAFFPAGLVLYWVVNNILSIAQQWHITRRIEQGAKA